MIYLAISSIIIALVLFLLAYRLRKKAGIPSGRVIYVDSSQWLRVEKPLFDRDLLLAGKPDYLVRQGKQVIPIEVKSGCAPRHPHTWHVSQLAAYCLLVGSAYGSRPDHGILHYADRTLSIPFTGALEATTRALIREMQGRVDQGEVKRSHNEPGRCLRCGYRTRCDQALRI